MNRLLAVLIIAAAGLVACSQSPDTATVAKAVQHQVRANLTDVNDLAGRLGGESAQQALRALGAPEPDEITVEHLEILESKRLDNGDYTLKVHYDLVTPANSRGVTRTIQLRAVDDGWQAVDYDPA